MEGRIHSYESFSAADGPGVRFVVFLQGCPLRCAYCHNPDTWETGAGERATAEQVADKIRRFRPYLKPPGGVTVSGGEPLLQWEFVRELFALLRHAGISTALDTSGIGGPAGADAVLEQTDLVLCDLKFPTEEQYRTHCGGSLAHALAFLELTAARGVPLWVRHVIVPGLTDSGESVRAVSRIARRYPNLEKLELLPFHKLCMSKYEMIGLPFPLKDTPACPPEELERLQRIADLEIRREDATQAE